MEFSNEEMTDFIDRSNEETNMFCYWPLLLELLELYWALCAFISMNYLFRKARLTVALNVVKIGR